MQRALRSVQCSPSFLSFAFQVLEYIALIDRIFNSEWDVRIKNEGEYENS